MRNHEQVLLPNWLQRTKSHHKTLCQHVTLMTPVQWETSKSLKSWKTVLTSSACDVRPPGLRETRLGSLAHCFLGNIGVNTKRLLDLSYLSAYISWRNPSTDPWDFLLLISKPEKLLEPSVYKMVKTRHGWYSSFLWLHFWKWSHHIQGGLEKQKALNMFHQKT